MPSDTRQLERREQLVEDFNESAADKCKCATGPHVKVAERSEQQRRHHDAPGRRRDVENGSVDIKQDRDLGDVDGIQTQPAEGVIRNEVRSHAHPENVAVTSTLPRAFRI